MASFTIGDLRSNTIPVVANPKDQPCSLILYLTRDMAGTQVVATFSASFISTGIPQDVPIGVSFINASEGLYYTWIAAFMNGRLVESFSQNETVQIGSGGVFDNMSTRAVVTSARTSNTVYRNNTGKVMFVVIAVRASRSSGAYTITDDFYAYADANPIPVTLVASGQSPSPSTGVAIVSLPFIVFPEEYYQLYYVRSHSSLGISYPVQVQTSWVEVY